jgi:putative hemolysin
MCTQARVKQLTRVFFCPLCENIREPMNSLFLCLILISVSFIFSANEIAILSLSRVQLKQIKDQSETLFKRLRTLIQDSIGFLITVLLFNELVNITMGSIITSNFIEPLPVSWQLKIVLGVLITTPIMLIFCELTPKVVATRSNRAVISIFLPIVYLCYLITKPLVALIKLFVPKQPVKEFHHLHEEDFLILAEEQTETGHLHETELELIRNVFEMDNTRVEQLVLPFRKMVTIPSTFTVEQAAAALLKDHIYSRVPITSKNREDIIGVLHTKDLVEIKVNPEIAKLSVMTIAKEPLFVGANLTLEALFKKMKSKKVQAAFVKSIHGKILGMITIQDILDTVIEEAFEE